MRFDVLTLFPEIFSGYQSQSLLNLAIQNGLVQLNLHDIRDWAVGKHRSVDDRPFGGGAGMVLRCEPVVESVEAIRQQEPDPGHLIFFTPQGRRLTQPVVEELSQHRRLVMVCGRYEGFDERIYEILQPDEISIGDFILSGGEVAAMVAIDAVVRLVPGVLGDEDSNRFDSFSGAERLLEHAQYTRPREYRGKEVPDVLLSGDHGRIAAWRKQQSLERTQTRRADLLEQPWADQASRDDSPPSP